MKNASARDRQSGLTLLELLVALVILGFLMVGLIQGVHAGLALRHAQTQRLGRTAELDAAMRLLRGMLARLPAAPAGRRAVASANAADTRFKGAADRVRFVGRMPTGLGTTRRADIKLYVQNQRLVLSWAPHYHERLLGQPPMPTTTILLYGVSRLDLRYWGSLAPDEPPGWLPRWENHAAPQLIRLRLSFVKGDPRRWPDLITVSGL
ncbi:MAG: prepilin-type N-terminal cleavage/methylation domain-containing protein [Stellaceae bacterium]